LGVGRAELLVDVSALSRREVSTDHDFALGTEAVANAGVRYFITPERLAFGVGAALGPVPDSPSPPKG